MAIIALQQAATQMELNVDGQHINADYPHVEAGQIQLLVQQQQLAAAREQLQAGWTQLAARRIEAEAADAAELAQIQAAREALAAETALRDEQQAKLSALS